MRSHILRVALVQFDARPERVDANVQRIKALATRAARQGAALVMFHEGTLCDYTPRLKKLAVRVPHSSPARELEKLARSLGIYLSYGLSEVDDERYYITQVFNAPHGFLYKYRKAWLWRDESDKGYRNEQARYDPGSGPELFEIAGLRATCFICADGEAPRCIERACALKPEIVFYPNNREELPGPSIFGKRARIIGAPMLVTNRVGKSWMHRCEGGSVVYDRNGKVLAAANKNGREEILRYDLPLRGR
jgi:predicted amidohydrolase